MELAMETEIAPNENSGLARFACDHCRQKKVGCSRELPKCSMCKPWPGKCTYSKTQTRARSKSRGLSSVRNRQARESSPKDLHGEGVTQNRVEKIESTLHQLSASVNQVLQDLSATRSISSPRDNDHGSSPGYLGETRLERSNTPLVIGPSHAFSFLAEASSNLETIRELLSPSHDHDNARQGLDNLSSTLTTGIMYEKGSDPSHRYWIPDPEVGHALISRFLQITKLGNPIFSSPSDEILRQVVFDPVNIRQKAWVVCFNYSMVALSSATNDRSQTHYTKMFRMNTRLALDDARIFLEPSEINAQTLMLLGLHGEDFASPNLSWMLVGHASRQVQALGLHLAGVGSCRDRDWEDQQRRLSLFWGLFAADKSCSLAFGRPCFLPTSVYEHVRLPDFRYLCKFRPHDQEGDSTFGAHHFARNVKLARITGRVLDFLSSGRLSVERNRLKLVLDSWWLESKEILWETLEADRHCADEEQLREMSLGIRSLEFQYHHTQILLLKDDPSFKDLRLTSAREAISLLQAMVSNWNSVYNGVIWHLLYYPFTPFFLIFAHIIDKDPAMTGGYHGDLGLLASTVSYFTRMKAKVDFLRNVVSRLERVADSFFKLAQRHVVNTHPAQSTHGLASDSPDAKSRVETVSPIHQHIASTPFSTNSGSDRPASTPPTFLNGLIPDHNMVYPGLYSRPESNDVLADVDALGLDRFLNWLPAELAASRATEISTTPGEQMTVEPTELHMDFTTTTSGLLDSTFDWLSWDTAWNDVDIVL